MKNLAVILPCLFLIISLSQCSGTQKPDPKITECKSKCGAAFEKCMKKGIKNEAKKAVCEAVNNKCSSDCEKR